MNLIFYFRVSSSKKTYLKVHISISQEEINEETIKLIV